MKSSGSRGRWPGTLQMCVLGAIRSQPVWKRSPSGRGSCCNLRAGLRQVGPFRFCLLLGEWGTCLAILPLSDAGLGCEVHIPAPLLSRVGLLLSSPAQGTRGGKGSSQEGPCVWRAPEGRGAHSPVLQFSLWRHLLHRSVRWMAGPFPASRPPVPRELPLPPTWLCSSACG